MSRWFWAWWLFAFLGADESVRGDTSAADASKGLEVTRIVVPGGLESLLKNEPCQSPSARGRLMYETLHQSRHHIAKVVDDAILVHEKLQPILSALYFRVFRVNLDSKCGATSGSSAHANVCSNDHLLSFMNTLNGFGKGNGSKSQDSSQVKVCHVGRCSVDDVPLHAQPKGLEHYVLRYAGIQVPDDWDPIDLYGRSPLYNDILGIHPANAKGPTTLVDLQRNPPSYTGYKGAKDWKRIYDENCCSASLDVPCAESECLYKLISGIQSSIAAWAAWNYQCTNPIEAYQLKTELPKYKRNAKFYQKQLGKHPDRLENLYYTFEAILRATCRMRSFLMGFAHQMGSKREHYELQAALFEFLNASFQVCESEAPYSKITRMKSKQLYNLEHPQLLDKIQGIAEIVDCVECEKCRLHGKIKLTALQITIRAFSSSESTQVLERNELVALVHALDYFAQSVIFVQKFKERQRRRLVMLPLTVMLTILVLLVVAYRKELVYAMFYCSLLDQDDDVNNPSIL